MKEEVKARVVDTGTAGDDEGGAGGGRTSVTKPSSPASGTGTAGMCLYSCVAGAVVDVVSSSHVSASDVVVALLTTEVLVVLVVGDSTGGTGPLTKGGLGC